MDVLHANAESFKYFYRNALKVKIGINTTILDVIVFCCFLGILFIFCPLLKKAIKVSNSKLSWHSSSSWNCQHGAWIHCMMIYFSWHVFWAFKQHFIFTLPRRNTYKLHHKLAVVQLLLENNLKWEIWVLELPKGTRHSDSSRLEIYKDNRPRAKWPEHY